MKQAQVPPKEAVALAVLTMLMHAINFGFVIVAGRFLAPSSFGALTALLGLVLLGMAPGMAVQALTAANVLGRPVAVDARTVRILGSVFGGVVGLLLLALWPFIPQLDVVSVISISVAAALLPASAAYEGKLQGEGKFFALGVVLLTGALAKFGIGALGMVVLAELWPAALGVVCGYGFQLVVATHICARAPSPVGGDYLASDPGSTVHTLPLRRLLVGVFTMLNVLVVVHLDSSLAQLLLTGESLGAYSVGATGMRIIFWAPQFLVLLAYPRLVADTRWRIVAYLIGGVTGLCVIAGTASIPLGPPLVDLVFGEYSAIGPQLWRFVWLGCCAVAIQLLGLSDIATGRYSMLMILTVVNIASSTTAFLLPSPTPVTLVTVMAAYATLAVVVGLWARWKTTATVPFAG